MGVCDRAISLRVVAFLGVSAWLDEWARHWAVPDTRGRVSLSVRYGSSHVGGGGRMFKFYGLVARG